MLNWLRNNRERIERHLQGSPERRFFSSALYAHYHIVLSLLQHYGYGKVIDIGCGYMPFKNFLSEKITDYDTLDLWPRLETVTYVGDIQDMSMISSATYDFAICLEVLEHVPDPFRAAREIYRILKPGGIALISIPHLSRIHDAPHDYFRFTAYGLQYLLRSAGFEVREIHRKGGMLSFLGHQVSTFLLSVAWPVPGLRQLMWFVNKWLLVRLCYKLDMGLDRSGIFSLGYVGVAQKPDSSNHGRVRN